MPNSDFWIKQKYANLAQIFLSQLKPFARQSIRFYPLCSLLAIAVCVKRAIPTRISVSAPSHTISVSDVHTPLSRQNSDTPYWQSPCARELSLVDISLQGGATTALMHVSVRLCGCLLVCRLLTDRRCSTRLCCSCYAPRNAHRPHSPHDRPR